MEKTRKKKIILIIILFLLAVFILWNAAWLWFHFGAVARYKVDGLTYSESDSQEISGREYVMESEDLINYSLIEAPYLSFTSYITLDTALLAGEDEFSSAQGYKFDYSMIAVIGLTGDITEYRFMVSPFDTESYQLEAVLLKVDKNGNLLNRDKLSEDELRVYEDAQPELLNLLQKVQEAFSIS